MGQVTIYLDAETERRMNKVLKKKRISKSKWIAGLIRERTEKEWPAHVAELCGAWKDFPLAEDLRMSIGADSDREEL